MRLEKRLHLRFVVEGSIVHNDQTVWPQFGQQHVLHPCTHRVVRAVAFKQHRRNPLVPTLRHDKVGALTIIAEDFSVH